jgi:hypothetical protein
MDREVHVRPEPTGLEGNLMSEFNENDYVALYSYWPILLAAGIILIPIGLVSLWEISVIGGVILLTSIMGWAWEARSEPKEQEDE